MRGFDFDKALVALQNELHCFAYKPKIRNYHPIHD